LTKAAKARADYIASKSETVSAWGIQANRVARQRRFNQQDDERLGRNRFTRPQNRAIQVPKSLRVAWWQRRTLRPPRAVPNATKTLVPNIMLCRSQTFFGQRQVV
jgi:hypothetical protein